MALAHPDSGSHHIITQKDKYSFIHIIVFIAFIPFLAFIAFIGAFIAFIDLRANILTCAPIY